MGYYESGTWDQFPFWTIGQLPSRPFDCVPYVTHLSRAAQLGFR